MSLADIKLTSDVTWPPALGIPLDLDKYPKIKALHERVKAHPKIAEWLAKRPETSFWEQLILEDEAYKIILVLDIH